MGPGVAGADATCVVTRFGASCADGSDTTLAVRAALAHCRRTGARKLLFPKGRYDFRPGRAAEGYCYVSNNDEGLKRVAFPLFGMQDLEIDGQGSSFVFHGYVVPFVLEDARGITLRDFSVDWARTFHSEGQVLSSGPDGVDLEIPQAFPYRIEHDRLVFTGEDRDLYPFGSLLEFDTRRRETAYMAHDYYTGPHVLVRELGPRRVRLSVPRLTATPGNTIVFGAAHRLCPAIVLSDSSEIRLRNVDLYHCGGMGVIAQRSHDVELDHVRVTPAPGRVVSLTADATHFVNCTGRIVMTECLFENQKDDATNIHGVYARVTQRFAPDALEVKLQHPQQFGFDFIVPGHRLELVHAPSLQTYHEANVKSAERLNREYTRVVFDEPLPPRTQAGDAVAAVQAGPDVVIRDCVIRGNRARGILLGARGRIVVEGNLFHTPGAAILMEGDARYWFEQAGVRDLVIRRNRFENCNFGVWGQAAIEVGAGIDEAFRDVSRYNRNVRIEDNLFRTFGPRLLRAYSVDGLTFRGNRVERTSEYPAPPKEPDPFDVTHSSNVLIEGR
jgi:hypothetical protein